MNTNRKVNELTKYYDIGQLTSGEYWDLRTKLTMPDTIRKRTVLCKPMGLLSHYLGVFTLDVCYERYITGNYTEDSIKSWRKGAILEKIKREKIAHRAEVDRVHALQIRKKVN